MDELYGRKWGFSSGIIPDGAGWRLICRQAAAAGPMAQGIDLFAHGDGQWRRGFQGMDNPLGGQLAPGGKGIVKRGDDRLLDLSAAIPVGGGGEGGDVEAIGVALALFEVNRKDLGPG